jgi:hypothetical protein
MGNGDNWLGNTTFLISCFAVLQVSVWMSPTRAAAKGRSSVDSRRGSVAVRVMTLIDKVAQSPGYRGERNATAGASAPLAGGFNISVLRLS